MKRSPQIEEAIIQSLKNGATMKEACAAAGVSRIALYQWRKEDADLNLKVEEAMSTRIEIVEDVVYMAAKNGDLRAALEWLEHKAGWQKKLNLSGKLEHEHTDAKDEDIIAAAEAVIKAVN